MDSWDVNTDFLEWMKKNYPDVYERLWKEFVRKTIGSKTTVVTKTLSNEELLDIVKKGFPNPRK